MRQMSWMSGLEKHLSCSSWRGRVKVWLNEVLLAVSFKMLFSLIGGHGRGFGMTQMRVVGESRYQCSFLTVFCHGGVRSLKTRLPFEE